MISRRPTLKMLSDQLGLSIAAVSRALKDSPDIGRDTIALVKKAAQEMGYVPDARGVKLRSGRTETIVFLKAIFEQKDIPDVDVASQIDGIVGELEGSGYLLQVMAWKPFTDATPLLKQIVSGRLADGILLDNTMPEDERVNLLAECQMPFVTFGRTELQVQHAFVDVDNELAAFEATAYLADRGHRRIAIIGPDPRLTYARQRLDGYKRALALSSLAIDPGLILDISDGASFCRSRVAELAGVLDPPTGFVAYSESSALGVMAGLRDVGWLHGRDFEVVSRDGLSMHDYFTPPVASCRLNMDTASRLLCRTLLRLLDGESPESLQTVLPCSLESVLPLELDRRW